MGAGEGMVGLLDSRSSSITYMLGDLRQFPSFSESIYEKNFKGYNKGNGMAVLGPEPTPTQLVSLNPRVADSSSFVLPSTYLLIIWQTPDGDRLVSTRLQIKSFLFPLSLPRRQMTSKDNQRGLPVIEW